MDIEENLRQMLKSCINQQIHIEGDIWLVPCLANYTENSYRPLLRPLNTDIIQNKELNKQGWTQLEEEILLKIVNSRGTKAWTSISKELNAIVHNGQQVRAGRHCREHWNNHINPSVIKGNWTEEEDSNLLDLFKTLGNRWSDIAKKVKGRTENSVKNRIKSLLKKKGIQENDLKKDSPKLGTTLDSLMSPKIINFDISEKVEQSPNANFAMPSPIEIRARFSMPSPIEIRAKFCMPNPIEIRPRFSMTSPIEIRPRVQRLAGLGKINQTRDTLKRDAILDSSFSPSFFLH